VDYVAPTNTSDRSGTDEPCKTVDARPQRQVGNIEDAEAVPTGSARQIALVNLRPLMDLTIGRPKIVVGLLDGPVASQHPDLGGPIFLVFPDQSVSVVTRTARRASISSATYSSGAAVAIVP
jgi:hypothetical protein